MAAGSPEPSPLADPFEHVHEYHRNLECFALNGQVHSPAQSKRVEAAHAYVAILLEDLIVVVKALVSVTVLRIGNLFIALEPPLPAIRKRRHGRLRNAVGVGCSMRMPVGCTDVHLLNIPELDALLALNTQVHTPPSHDIITPGAQMFRVRDPDNEAVSVVRFEGPPVRVASVPVALERMCDHGAPVVAPF